MVPVFPRTVVWLAAPWPPFPGKVETPQTRWARDAPLSQSRRWFRRGIPPERTLFARTSSGLKAPFARIPCKRLVFLLAHLTRKLKRLIPPSKCVLPILCRLSSFRELEFPLSPGYEHFTVSLQKEVGPWGNFTFLPTVPEACQVLEGPPSFFSCRSNFHSRPPTLVPQEYPRC